MAQELYDAGKIDLKPGGAMLRTGRNAAAEAERRPGWQVAATYDDRAVQLSWNAQVNFAENASGRDQEPRTVRQTGAKWGRRSSRTLCRPPADIVGMEFHA